MEDAIRTAIERQARKLIERDKADQFSNLKHQRRFKVRAGISPISADHRQPGIWTIAPHFDPVYCIKHSKYISRTIWRKILERKYKVTPAVLHQIPKDSGGTRDIMVFSIPDAAIANLFNRKLRDRNKNIQSPFCYSYRRDRSIFDAVIYTSALLKSEGDYPLQTGTRIKVLDADEL